MKNLARLSAALLLLFLLSTTAFAQSGDTRYDANLNLPFNQKAGDVNPQTGNITLSYTDVALPGRAGFNFSFGRIWSLNQSNVFNMYYNQATGQNSLNSNTLEGVNRLGAGWSTSLPYLMTDSEAYYQTLNLFFGGSVYQVDQTGIELGDNPSRSNLLGYDLTNIRIFKSSGARYDRFTGLAALKAKYNKLTDLGSDNSMYSLVTKTNEKYYFRADGKLMMQEDRIGINRIWYFYEGSRLSVVVDSVGREIRFSYTPEGNLASISWDVTIGTKDAEGNRNTATETRSISYGYLDGETSHPEIVGLKNNVLNYRKPYILSSVTDNMGHVTKYDYQAGLATFSYDVANAHNENIYLMLKEISSVYTPDGKFKNKRAFEYEVPAKGMYTKHFYNGMSEYYKISRQYVVNKNGRIMNDTTYRYYDKNENGNYNSYSTEIKVDRLTTTYKYKLGESHSSDHVLESITLTDDDDSYNKHKLFYYDSKRAKIQEDTYKLGTLIYSEKFRYDLKGNMNYHEDKVGLVTTTTYDSLYSIPLSRVTKVTVNGIKEDYRSEKVLNNLGQVEQQLIYLKKNGTTRAVTVATMDYDIYGNPVSKTDAAGNTIYTIYDSATNSLPVKTYQDVSISKWASGTVHSSWQTEPLAEKKKVRIRSWKVYNSDGKVWLEIDNEGYTIEHYYDRNGQEIEIVNPDSDDDTTFATPVDLSDAAQVAADFDDFRDNPAYANFLLKRKNNPGARMEIDYQNDFVKSFADIDRANGHVKITGREGNGSGNVLREIEYRNGIEYAVKSMQYDPYGRMIVLTDADADRTAGVPMTIDGNEYMRYDKSWVIRYDVLGRKLKVLYPETRNKTDVKYISYNDIANSVTTTDPEGITTEETFDWNGNLIKMTRYGRDGFTSADKIESYSFEYDELKRKTKLVDSMGLVTDFKYDERSLLIEQRFGSSGSDIMNYDDRGYLVNKTDRKGNRLEFTYDSLGRNLETQHFANGSLQSITKVDYDNRGNVVRVNNGKLIEHYKYDYGNRVTLLERKLADTTLMTKFSNTVWTHTGASDIFSFSYKYNDAGMVTEMFYPDGSVHRYDYDAELSRLQKIHEAVGETELTNQLTAPGYKGYVDSLSYTRSGVVTGMSYQNGTSQGWEFDNRKRISRTTIAGITENIADLNFSLNGNGDIERINNNEYRYDGFNRIIYAKTQTPNTNDRQQLVAKHFGTYNNGGAVNGVLYNTDADLDGDGRVGGIDHIIASFDQVEDIYDEESFEYDKNGNRTKLIQNGDIYSYEYGARNRLEKIYIMREGEHTKSLFGEYLYDANGNTIKRTLHTKEGLKVVEFEYDTMNRVKKTTENGINETRYTYDNAGNRLTKETGGQVTLYLRHGQIAVAMDIELNTDINAAEVGKINRYILSGDLLAGRVTKEFTRNTTTKVIAPPIVKKYWYHLDHLNSTKAVTKEDGTVEVLYEYRAFGEQLKKLDGAGNDTGDEAKYSYGGKELDSETNLYYFNARYYDATTGRFINVDPIQDGTNWYIYCNNNPMNRVDPTGLMSKNGYLTSEELGGPKFPMDARTGWGDAANSLGDYYKNVPYPNKLVYPCTSIPVFWLFTNKNGEEFKIQIWKGRYPWGIGGEVGIYKWYSNEKGRGPNIFNGDDKRWGFWQPFSQERGLNPDVKIEMTILDENGKEMFTFVDKGQFWLTAFKHNKGRYVMKNWRSLTLKFRVTGLDGWDESMRKKMGDKYDDDERWITWKNDEKIGDFVPNQKDKDKKKE